MSDFYEDAAMLRYRTLEAAKAQCQADLARYQAAGDEYAAAEELQTLATLNDQVTSLQRLHNQYRQQMNPPSQATMTDSEFMALSPERMAQHPEAIDRLFSKSKYYSPDQWSDPKVQGLVRAGMDEVQRRRRYEAGGR